jgi:hypothetical protein
MQHRVTSARTTTHITQTLYVHRASPCKHRINIAHKSCYNVHTMLWGYSVNIVKNSREGCNLWTPVLHGHKLVNLWTPVLHSHGFILVRIVCMKVYINTYSGESLISTFSDMLVEMKLILERIGEISGRHNFIQFLILYDFWYHYRLWYKQFSFVSFVLSYPKKWQFALHQYTYQNEDNGARICLSIQ